MLLGGNALVAQVQGDLETQLDQQLTDGDSQLDTGDQPPLTLNNMRLPADLLANLPPGTKIDAEDLSKLKLPDGMQVDLPEGFDLSDLDFDLPSEFDLHLPEGSRFDPSTGNLSLPNGGAIILPNGQKTMLPPGTNLTLPREVIDQLLAQGLPAGTLPRDMTFHLEDLPPDPNVKMDPPPMRGNGTLDLPPGTELKLPPGFDIPPEALAGLIPFLLPEGTEIVVPPGNDYDWPLPEPDPDAREPPPGEGSTPADPGVPIATDIDTWPSRIAKGEPFFVEGYVRERESGRDVVDAPVVIYMNETKDAPGVKVGEGTSDARGRFRIGVELPTDKPARQWQLVNSAGGFTNAAGTRYGIGWGDPPIETFASTAWTLQVPARDGVQSAVPIRGTLLDDTGAPVPLARVEVLVEGVVVRQGATAVDGTFSTTHVFSATGTYRVQLRFPGNAYYDASLSDERSLRIEDVALDVPTSVRVHRGEALTLTGRVLVSGVASPGKEVEVETPFGTTTSAVTDSGGRFTVMLRVPETVPPGAHPVTFRATEWGISKATRVDVWTKAQIVLDVPERARAEPGATFTARVEDASGALIPGQVLRLQLSGPGGADDTRTSTTNAPSRITLSPPRPLDGVYRITASLDTTEYVEALPAEKPITLGTLVVDWDLPEKVVRGRDAAVSATLRFAGQPLVREPIMLGFFTPYEATTDASGRATWTMRVPQQASPGPSVATISVPSHGFTEARGTTVYVMTRLSVDAPRDYVPGESVGMTITLVDDADAPVVGHTLELAVASGDWSARLTGITDADGVWRPDVATRGAPREELAIAARHPEASHHLASDATAASRLAAGATGALNIPPLLWGVPLAAVAVAGGAGALWRQRTRARSGGAAAAALAAMPRAGVLHAPGFDLQLGIPDGEPLVWGVGEPLDVVITPTGAAVGRGNVRLQGGGIERTFPLEPGVPQRASLRFDEEGDFELTASRADDALAAPVTTPLRIVQYHKEISREFDVLLDRARHVERGIDKQSTPQEVEWMLGHRLGPSAATPLAEMALVMDLANYSAQSIRREEYLRFVEATRALHALLPGGAA